MSERRKLFVAANPWPLAAKAKEMGLPTHGRFYEADIPSDRVYVVDVDELLRALYSIRDRVAGASSAASSGGTENT